MNKITRGKELMVPKVTTGPISASSKVYVSPEGQSDVRVPLREIALSKESGEPPFRVYDPSGPYTDAATSSPRTTATSLASTWRATFPTSPHPCADCPASP